MYDNGVTGRTITEDDAEEVYRTYTSHQTQILAYENEFSSAITFADRDYKLTGNDVVQTLEVSLTFAANKLKSIHVDVSQNTVVTSAEIDVLDIQIADENGDTLIGNTRNGYQLSAVSIDEKNDLLIGSDKKDFLIGGGGKDVLIGNGGDDTLEGGDGQDYLVGGEGYDILEGGGEDDILVGGNGLDTYIINSANGSDTIDDTGQSILKRDGNTYTGLFRFDSATNKYVLDDNSGATIVINSPATLDFGNGDSVTFQDLTTVDLVNDNLIGIQLLDTATDINTQYFGTDNAEFIFDFNDGKTIKRYNDPGDPAVDEVTFTSPVSKIVGKGGNDTIQIDADIPNIIIFGDTEGDVTLQDGDDFIEVDRTNVFNNTILGNFSQGATLFGGGGDDFLGGGQRNDFLYGQEDHDFLSGNAGADLIFGGSGNDFLEGDENSNGFDQLFGDQGNDYLLGGEGKDLLFGGDGNDRLYGDTDSQGFYNNGTVKFYNGDTGLFNPFDDPFSDFQVVLTEVASAEAGDDILDGGQGDDLLYGGMGNDTLYGGSDNDILQGEAGNDFLKGEAGQDILWGDKDAASFDSDNAASAISTADDTYIFQQHADGKDVAGDDILDGGTDNDKLYIAMKCAA